MRSKYQIEKKEEYIYYNAIYYNNTVDDSTSYFQDARTSPILDIPKNYKMAISRLNVPTQGLPIFNFASINNDGKTPDNSFYSFTLRWNAVTYRRYVQYIPYTSIGLGVYNYSNYVRMMNEALFLVFNDMKIAFPGFPPTSAPYLCLDGSLVNLYTPLAYNDATISLSCNYQIYKFLLTIPAFGNSYSDPNGEDFIFSIQKTGNNIADLNNPIPSTSLVVPGGAYVIRMEYSNLGNWSTLRSILVVSNSLGGKGENISTPKNQNYNTSLNVITDFEIDRSGPLLQVGRTYYLYQADLYRYITLDSENSLREIDLKLYYSDIFGVINELPIPPGFFWSIKIVFEKLQYN